MLEAVDFLSSSLPNLQIQVMRLKQATKVSDEDSRIVEIQDAELRLKEFLLSNNMEIYRFNLSAIKGQAKYSTDPIEG